MPPIKCVKFSIWSTVLFLKILKITVSLNMELDDTFLYSLKHCTPLLSAVPGHFLTLLAALK